MTLNCLLFPRLSFLYLSSNLKLGAGPAAAAEAPVLHVCALNAVLFSCEGSGNGNPRHGRAASQEPTEPLLFSECLQSPAYCAGSTANRLQTVWDVFPKFEPLDVPLILDDVRHGSSSSSRSSSENSPC